MNPKRERSARSEPAPHAHARDSDFIPPDPAELRGPFRSLYFPFREVIAHPDGFGPARLLVHAFYGFLFFYIFTRVPEWRHLIARPNVDPLWPVQWVQLFPWHTVVLSIGMTALFGSLAAALFPHRIWARLIAFAGVFLFEALTNSYGKINHSAHLLVLTSAVFMLLPDHSRRADLPPDRKRAYLEVFWAAQAIILLTYSLAGIAKLRGAWINISGLQRSLLSVDALSYYIAFDYVSGGKSSVLGLGEWLIDHPRLGYPLLLGATMLELFSFAIAWRPGLHRIWGLALILLHVGIALVMEVFFMYPIFILGLLFFFSPFDRSGRFVDATLRDLPWLGPFFSALRGEMRTQREPDDATGLEPIVVFFDPALRRHQRLVGLVRRSRPSAAIVFEPKSGDRYRELALQRPYLERARSVVVYTQPKGRPEVRVRSEATLWLLAHVRKGPWNALFIAHVVPLPLLDLLWFLAAPVAERLPLPAASVPLPTADSEPRADLLSK